MHISPPGATRPETTTEAGTGAARRRRRATSTASFGSAGRESHDASGFYERFVAPEISTDSAVAPARELDVIYDHDARDMSALAPDSVALVVTSPPYFAGKEYEQELGKGGVPGTYFEYLSMLEGVFAECKRVLEPGGRIAVNVANLGRRPYRSLAGDVTGILQDLGLLLRGEVVWWKGRAAGGSCAWGSFQRPGNPVLRDVTERIVIASKGRFDRALKPEERLALGLPSTATISRDEFLEATTDLWEIAPESATRVGHPAPFPVELPARLIELYTYEEDLVLDPFMGSGSTALAAVRAGRHFVGFETDAAYAARARERVAADADRAPTLLSCSVPFAVKLPAARGNGAEPGADARGRAIREGRKASELAAIVLETCGFAEIRTGLKIARLGIELDLVARDATGADWAFELAGGFTTNRLGLRRADTLWKAIGKAAVLHGSEQAMPLVLLTTDAAVPNSAGHAALQAVRGPGRPVFDVVELLDTGGEARLGDYARRGMPPSER